MKKVLIVAPLVTILLGVGIFLGYKTLVKNDDEAKTVEKAEASDQAKEKAPAVAEAQEISKKVYERFIDTLYKTGEKNDWYGTDSIDYEILYEELSPYVTRDFFELIKSIPASEIYCECDSLVFENPEFEVRNKVITSQSDYMKTRTVSFENEIKNGAQVFLEYKKEKAKWKLHTYNVLSVEDKPLNLTKDEAETYVAEFEGTVNFVKEANYSIYDGRDVENYYIFHAKKSDQLYAVDSKSGYMTSMIPPGLVPAELRDKIETY